MLRERIHLGRPHNAYDMEDLKSSMRLTSKNVSGSGRPPSLLASPSRRPSPVQLQLRRPLPADDELQSMCDSPSSWRRSTACCFCMQRPVSFSDNEQTAIHSFLRRFSRPATQSNNTARFSSVNRNQELKVKKVFKEKQHGFIQHFKNTFKF